MSTPNRLFLLHFLVFMLSSSCALCMQASSQENSQRLRSETVKIFDAVAVAPIEIKAHLYFAMLAREPIPYEFLLRSQEELFFQANQAKLKFPVAPGVSAAGYIGDSDAALDIAISKRMLDRLSIQSRAIEGILRTDPSRALDLFEMVNLDVAPETCRSAVRPDPSVYYKLLGNVFRLGFTKEQRKRGDDTALLLRRGAIQSAVQILPLLRTIQSLDLSAATKAQIIARVTTSIDSLPLDDRSFTSLLKETTRFIVDSRSAPSWTAEGQKSLEVAWLRYGQQSLAARRCPESVRSDLNLEELKILGALDTRQEAGSFKVQSQISSDTFNERAEFFQYWTADGGGPLMNAYQKLKFGPLENLDAGAPSIRQAVASDPVELSAVFRASTSWRESCSKLFRSIESWEKDSKLEPRHRFVILAEMYLGLLNIIPSEDQSGTSEALQRMLKLLLDESIRRDYPVLWLLKWSDLNTCLLEPDRKGLLRAAIQSSGDAVMTGLLEMTGDHLGDKK